MMDEPGNSRSAPTPIIFCHFPKAGGSSIARILREQFNDACLLDYNHDPLECDNDEIVRHLPSNVDCVLGHFRPDRYDEVKNRFIFTFLRQPIDNLLSIYFFWETYPRSGNIWHQKFLDEMPDIIQFAKYAPIQNLMSKSYFGSFDMRKFDFIGFHETRNADLNTLSVLTSINFKSNVHENITENGVEKRKEMMRDNNIMGDLQAILADDIRFYDTLISKR